MTSQERCDMPSGTTRRTAMTDTRAAGVNRTGCLHPAARWQTAAHGSSWQRRATSAALPGTARRAATQLNSIQTGA